MPHLLADLDGKRKYVFSKDGEDFYLRVVTSAEEMRKCVKASELLGTIKYESELQLQEEIKKSEQKLKTDPQKPTKEQMNEWAEKGLPSSFADESKNQTAFILENEAAETATIILLTINDPKKCKDLDVSENIGTFVYVGDIQTAEEFRGKNLLSASFDKVLTMLSNPKRKLPRPLEFSISMTSTTAIKEEDNSEVEYVRNLPRYTEMWLNRFLNNDLQNRWQYRDENGHHQIGLNRMSLDEYLENGKINEKEISGLMQSQAEKAKGENKQVRGLYLEGVNPNYETTKIGRENRISGKNTFSRNKTEDKKDWQQAPNPIIKDASLEILKEAEEEKTK